MALQAPAGPPGSRQEPALAAYALPPPAELVPLARTGINNQVMEVRAGPLRYVWKRYQSFEDPAAIRYEHRLLGWLATQGLPFAVPVPVPTRTGDTLCPTPEGWAALFPLLPGSPPELHDPGQVEAVGEALGALHAVLVHYPRTARPAVYGYANLTQIHPALPDPAHLTPETLALPLTPQLQALLARWRQAVQTLMAWLQDQYARLPHQVIHGDFVPGNTLLQQGRVSAVLDFEMAGVDARAMDVASGLAFAMRVWETPDPWPRVTAFCRGYRRQGRLTDAEVAALPHLIHLRDVASTIWWLGRGLQAGDGAGQLWRIRQTLDTGVWLTTHAREFRERLAIMV